MRAARLMRIDVEDPVERGQIDRHHSGVTVTDPGLDSAGHRRPAAEGDGRQSFGATPVEDRFHLGLGGGMGDHVRRVLELAEQVAGDVAEGLAVGVGGAVLHIGATDLLQ